MTADRLAVVSVVEKIEAGALRAGMNLPERLQRLLAGRPVVLDGQTLAVDTQLMLRLQRRLASAAGAETLPIAEGRAETLHQTRVAGGKHPIGTGARPRGRRPSPGAALHAGRADHGPAGLLPRRRLDVGRPRHPRRAVPLPGRAGRSAGAGGRLPARARAPVPGGVRRRDRCLRVGGRATPSRWAPTRPGSRSAATRRAATWRLASRSRPLGRAGRSRCSCWSTPATDFTRDTRSFALFADRGFYLTQALHGARRTPATCHPTSTGATHDSHLCTPTCRTAWRRRTSSRPASTRCATRARPTRGSWWRPASRWS